MAHQCRGSGGGGGGGGGDDGRAGRAGEEGGVPRRRERARGSSSPDAGGKRRVYKGSTRTLSPC
eukprot:228435-Prorocentrum_minimum.AAC.1